MPIPSGTAGVSYPSMVRGIPLPIVDNKKRYHIALIITVALWFTSVLLYIINKKYEMLAFYTTIPGFLMAVAVNFMRQYNIRGHLTLTADSLIVEMASVRHEYYLDQLENLRIYCNEFEGDPPGPRAYTRKKGINNHLKFDFEMTEVSYRLLFKREYITPLNAIFETWRDNNYRFRLYDSWGMKMKNLS